MEIKTEQHMITVDIDDGKLYLFKGGNMTYIKDYIVDGKVDEGMVKAWASAIVPKDRKVAVVKSAEVSKPAKVDPVMKAVKVKEPEPVMGEPTWSKTPTKPEPKVKKGKKKN
jgi:hypothetical protein